VNQEIGIAFSVTGHDKIIQAVQAVETRFDSLGGKLQSWTQQMHRLAGGFQQAAGFLRDFGAGLGTMSGQVRTASTALGGIHSNIDSINRTRMNPNIFDPVARSAETAKKAVSDLATSVGAATKKVGAATAGPGAVVGMPGATGGGSKGGSLSSGNLLGLIPGFWLRWQLLSAGLHGAHALGRGAVAADRKQMAEALGLLSSVGFGAQEKDLTEAAGHRFAQKLPSVAPEQYVKTMSQTASAFDVNKLGLGQLQAMNEAAIMAGKIAQMDPSKAAEQLSKITLGYGMAQGGETYKALTGGGRANVRGFGNVNLGEMYQQNAAWMAKIVEKSNIWGTGVMDFMQYAAPTMAQHGWNPAAQMAWAGAMADSGYKGAKAGRASKDMMARPEALARLMMLGNREMAQDLTTGKIGPVDPMLLRQRTAQVSQAMQDPQKFAALITDTLSKNMHLAQRLKTDEQFGLNMVKDLGMSRDFLPALTSILSSGFIERFKEFLEALSSANMQGLAAQSAESVSDTYYQWQQLENAASSFWKSIQKSKGAISRAVGGLADIFDKAREGSDRQNQADILTGIAKKYGPFRKPEDALEASAMDIQKEKLRKELNEAMDKGYQQDLRNLGPRPGKENPLEQEEWDRRKNLLWNQWRDLGTDIFEKRTENSILPNSVREEFSSNMNSVISGLGQFRDALANAIPSWLKTPVFGGKPEHYAPPKPEQYVPPSQKEAPLPSEAEYLHSLLKPASLKVTEGAAAGGINVRVFLDGNELRTAVQNVLIDEGMHNRARFGGGRTS
jgi:hypothetical protein